MLTTTGVLIIGSLAALLGGLLRGPATAAQMPDTLLLLGATVAFSLARRPRRP